MGKVDDMRRQREERFEQDAKDARTRAATAAAKRASSGPAPAAAPIAAPPAPPAPAPAIADDDDDPPALVAPRKATGDERGPCSVCGKPNPLHNGLVANHQKGLGKYCPGSRKPPG